MTIEIGDFDPFAITEAPREPLRLDVSLLLAFYCAAVPAPSNGGDGRTHRLTKWREQFKGFAAWQVTPAHINAMVGAREAA